MSQQPDPHLIPAPDEARDVVADLVERYRRNADQYTSAAYKEAEARAEFIDPFFEALGWDIANKEGYTEPYKEVIHNPSLEVEGATKEPDYCFRISGQRKFFLEAKKPSVHIKTDPSPAYQLRRYGWSAKLPLSILTNFEEFAVYNCRIRPRDTDGATVARDRFITYDQYLERLDDIYSIFAREAIPKGLFDRYAEDARRKRGTAEVDSEFLKEIEAWRELLAKDIGPHNLGLSVHDVNFAVQATIDRILFFRIAEDRGVEPYGRLQSLLDGKNLYPRLCDLYNEADAKYNAGLFNFSETGDILSQHLQISDKTLKAILSQLYYPQCPYQFSVIGADILGAVYEQFLGKVIRLTPSHRAKVEEKPEVKKAGGVYYTPTYIVDYIVEQTVGEALKEAKTPKQASKMRILDPACGSGSFLLGAYQYLLNWHLDYYTNHDPKKHTRGKQPALVQVRTAEWRLSTFERKRILLNNIYGVDIDPQAVEVTKLNLLLKCLEGETGQTLNLHYRLLPNIDDNIKCGNSLIGIDYSLGRMLNDEECRRVNPFDWEAEFADIMSAGGFDCVIGNPPYLSFSGRQKPDGYEESINYWKKRYPWDAWPTSHGLFLVRSLALRREGGFASFIVPDQVGHLDGYAPLREHIADRSQVIEVRYWGEDVFRGVVTPAMTVILGDKGRELATVIIRDGTATPINVSAGDRWIANQFGELLTKIAAIGASLGEAVKDPGVHTGNCAGKLIIDTAVSEGKTVPVLEGKQISRYACGVPRKRLRLDYRPRSREYFRIGDTETYRKARFVIRQTAPYPIVGPREGADYFRNSLLALYPWLPHDSRYVVGVLNSGLLRFVYEQTTTESGQKAFPQVKIGSLRQLPIRTIDFSDPADVARHDKMVGLVEKMLALHQRLAEAKTPTPRNRLQRQIAATDQAIDALVYELYDLTDEEIKIVEQSIEKG